MLPPGIYSLAQIAQEPSLETQVTRLVTLLEFLLTQINPHVTPREGHNVGVTERVNANQHLFTAVGDLLFAIRVRNDIIHAARREKPLTKPEIERAVKHLRNGLQEIRDHYRIPADIKRSVFQASAPRPTAPPQPPPPRPTEPLPRPPNFQHVNEVHRAKPIDPPAPPRIVVPTPQSASAPRLKHPVRWALLLIAIGTLLAYSGTLWRSGVGLFYGRKEEAQRLRREAETALKRIQGFDKQHGFAARINDAQTAWRTARIAFDGEQFKAAITDYQRVLQIADELTTKDYDRTEAQRLLGEMQSDRRTARAEQIPQTAPQLWQEAETARLAAATAFNNANFAEAKQQALLARQKYEEARGALTASPSPTPTATEETTPSPTPPSTPEPLATMRPLDPTPTAAPRATPTPPPPPPDEPEEDDIFFIRQKEFMYYVTKQVAPTLPPEARAQGISGPVEIEVVLGRDGRLSQRHVLSGHPLLRQAALDALRQWQFRPYQQDRKPIDVRSEITINVR